MPIYEFQCLECFHKFEEVQGIKDPPLLFCPRCHGEVQRRFFEWDEKLADYRKYNTQITEAPVLPYIFYIYLILLLLFGILGGLTYSSLHGFLGIIIFSLGVSVISFIGALPVIGPIAYVVWLGPFIKSFMIFHIALSPSTLSTFIYWSGFVFAVVLSIFTTFYTIYRVKTPILWVFLEPLAQEKLRYILLTRLLNYEVSYVWIDPEGHGASLAARILKIKQFPAVRLMGKNYYSPDIPVGPIKAIEERRNNLLKQAMLQK